MTLQKQIEEVEKRIDAACKRSGRKREEINIVAVTKYVSLERTDEVIASGYAHIGENRWPEAKDKRLAIGDKAKWHFIGHLQSRKVKDVLPYFDYIHSLDRLSLAKEIQKRMPEDAAPMPCFIQVNVSGEETKHGLQPEELIPFAKEIASMNRIHVIGLMTMAPHEPDPEDTRGVFRGLRELLAELNQAGVFADELTELSMGMSNDFEVAIEEGATWLRLGTVLVGNDRH